MLGYSDIFQFLIAAAAIVVSIVLHELAHGYVALWNGDATAKVNGRLTLNPLAHFDPFGLVMLLLVRFGYARPVPVNPDNFCNRRLGMITVTFSYHRRTANCPLYLLCRLSTAAVLVYLGNFFYWMIIINVNLALFNLLPVFPLDGYRVIESVTRATNPFNRFMRNYGQYVLIILIGISVLVDLFHMPYYFDIIGMYINTFRNWIVDGFLAFWGLLF